MKFFLLGPMDGNNLYSKVWEVLFRNFGFINQNDTTEHIQHIRL